MHSTRIFIYYVWLYVKTYCSHCFTWIALVSLAGALFCYLILWMFNSYHHIDNVSSFKSMHCLHWLQNVSIWHLLGVNSFLVHSIRLLLFLFSDVDDDVINSEKPLIYQQLLKRTKTSLVSKNIESIHYYLVYSDWTQPASEEGSGLGPNQSFRCTLKTSSH